MKLLPPALEALKAQETHTFLKGAEVFQNPRTSGDERPLSLTYSTGVLVISVLWLLVLLVAALSSRPAT